MPPSEARFLSDILVWEALIFVLPQKIANFANPEKNIDAPAGISWTIMEMFLFFPLVFLFSVKKRKPFGPGSPPWQGGILPLDYRRIIGIISSNLI